MNIEEKMTGEAYKGATYADKLLRTALDIAENILKCGGTVHRVEETIDRVCKSKGAAHVEVFSITSVIIASIRMNDGEYSMQTRRIYGCSNNFTRLDMLNSISRDICAGKVDLDEAQRLIKEAKSTKPYPMWLTLVAAMVISGSFAMFFGGTAYDAIAAAVLALIIKFISFFAPKTFNQLATSLVLSTIAGFLAIIFTKLGFGDHYDKLIIGTIMLVIPGLSFGTSIRDLLCGDTLSGILQLFQSLLLAAIIAFGYTIALFFLGPWVN